MNDVNRKNKRTASTNFWDVSYAPVAAGELVAQRRPDFVNDLFARYGNPGPGVAFHRWTSLRGSRLALRLSCSSRKWLKRGTDILIASMVLVSMGWLLVPVYLFTMMSRQAKVVLDRKIGRWGETFSLPRLVWRATGQGISGPANAALRLWPVFLGHSTLIGPRPLSPRDMAALPLQNRRRVEIKPGLLGLHSARQLANMAFEDENAIENEYVDTLSPGRDLSIVATAVLGRLLHRRNDGLKKTVSPTLDILGVRVGNVSMAQATAKIVDWLDGDKTRFVAFLNAHCANVAATDNAYRSAIGQADIVLADGIGIRIASAILGEPVRENVNGTDLIPRLCDELDGRRLFLLGAAPGVAEDVAKRLQERFDGLAIVGIHSGFFNREQEPALVETIAKSQSDLLLVAMGVPAQELFIARNLDQLHATVVIGVGGLFDFIAGRIRRAPLWMRELGLEWVYRFIREPMRMWRRYLLGNGLFVARVLSTRIGRSRHHRGG